MIPAASTSTRTRTTSVSVWFAIAIFALALVVVLLLFWRAYDQKQRASMAADESSEMVKSVKAQNDGDTHIQVSDGADFIIAECIPNLRCAVIPDVGQTVTIRGISRYDRENRWYEVHPVEEIEVKK